MTMTSSLEIQAKPKRLYIVHSRYTKTNNIYANKQSFHQSSYLKMLQNSVIRQKVSLVLRILAFRGTFLVVTEQPLAVFILEDALDSLIRPATFLSHRRKPEVNITHPRTVFSPRFSN